MDTWRLLLFCIYTSMSTSQYASMESGISTRYLSSKADNSCEDKASWCGKLGHKISISRCYRHGNRCCETCRRLQLSLPECPYGDRDSWCSSLGVERPTSDCYRHNHTCCHTCHLYDSGIPVCPFGDRYSRCAGIGQRYSVSSCYTEESNCCDTCFRLRSNIPDCAYGDREQWCSLIGDYYPISSCLTYRHQCCARCHYLSTNNITDTTIGTAGSQSSTKTPEIKTFSTKYPRSSTHHTLSVTANGQINSSRATSYKVTDKKPNLEYITSNTLINSSYTNAASDLDTSREYSTTSADGDANIRGKINMSTSLVSHDTVTKHYDQKDYSDYTSSRKRDFTKPGDARVGVALVTTPDGNLEPHGGLLVSNMASTSHHKEQIHFTLIVVFLLLITKSQYRLYT